MKATILMKIAVVFMAAFGAYAFSADTSSQNMFTRSDTCENITAGCNDDGLEACTIQVESSLTPVLDLECDKVIRHISKQPVNWSYEL